MRSDARLGHDDDVRGMVRQRLEEANLRTDEVTIDAVVAAMDSA
jgi:hypothetical protein